MNDIGALVERLVGAGLSIGEAGAIIAEAFAAGAAGSSFRKSTNAERQQRYRDRKKGVTNRNETVTTLQSDDVVHTVTNRNETVTNRNDVTSPLSSSNLDLRKKRERGSRIAPDWKPDRDFAKHLGWSEFQIDAEEANFRDYWLGCAGSKGVKLDWAATWRKWIRNSRTKPAGNVLTASQVVDVNWDDVLARFKKMGHWSKWAGPDPSSAACRAPVELLAKYGIGPVAEVSRPPPAPLLRAM